MSPLELEELDELDELELEELALDEALEELELDDAPGPWFPPQATSIGIAQQLKPRVTDLVLKIIIVTPLNLYFNLSQGSPVDAYRLAGRPTYSFFIF